MRIFVAQRGQRKNWPLIILVIEGPAGCKTAQENWKSNLRYGTGETQ
jgi:hypothetical protein